MAFLSRDEILNADDLKTEDIDVPLWGGTVRVRSMTGKEREEFYKKIDFTPETGTSNSEYRARLITFTVAGEDGKRLFTEGDIAALEDKSLDAVLAVCLVAERLNGIGNAASKEIEKNSDAVQNGDSTSDSASS